MTQELDLSNVVWQAFDIELCPSCQTPSHMFISNIHTPNTIPACAKCSISSAVWNIQVLFSMIDRFDAQRALIESLASQYDNRTLGVTDLCIVCNRPFLEGHSYWDKVTAIDSQGTEFIVHKKCSASGICDHEECEGLRHITGWRGHFAVDPYRQEVNWHPVYTSVAEGTSRCNRHHEEWVANEGSDNVFSCDQCGDWFVRDRNDFFYYYDQIYCENCRDDYFSRCDYCDEMYHDNDDHNCSQEEEQSVIHSYSYKPVPCFFGDPEPIRYHLGFELEVESRDDEPCESSAVVVQQELGSRAYLKYDGSLSYGFEIVTHPHTLTEYKTNFPWEFIERAKSERLISWNSPRCGFHVHVSRYAFGPGMREDEHEYEYYKRTIIVRQQHELKFIKLIYDNERQVQRLAGRKSDWAKFTDKGNLWRKVKHGYQSEGHYSAVNVENVNTIEVRVFRGSLKRERLLADLEFVHAGVEYTRNLRVTATNKALSWVAFSGYVYQNADKYPNLLELMEKSNATESVYDNRTEDGED